MPKWAKLVVAILLLPFCAGGAWALWKVLRQTGDADTFWAAALGGAGCWWAIYLFLPKPMWVYVAGHEVTHALWVWLFGGRVKRFKISSKGGQVVTTRNNFLISLAPYFFPVYVVLVIAVFLLGDLVWEWTPYRVWFHFLIGAAYAFHVTLTWHILQTRQTDVTSQGYLFSAVVIYLGNLLVLMIGVPLLAGRPGVGTAFAGWLAATQDLLTSCLHAIGRPF